MRLSVYVFQTAGAIAVYVTSPRRRRSNLTNQSLIFCSYVHTYPNDFKHANSTATTQTLRHSHVKQASAAFPENTLASFERAIRDGSEGIESGNVSLHAKAR